MLDLVGAFRSGRRREWYQVGAGRTILISGVPSVVARTASWFAHRTARPEEQS